MRTKAIEDSIGAFANAPYQFCNRGWPRRVLRRCNIYKKDHVRENVGYKLEPIGALCSPLRSGTGGNRGTEGSFANDPQRWLNREIFSNRCDDS